MQEPEIFEQPVGNNRDPEAIDLGPYGPYRSPGPAPVSPADDASDEYHDFVYPEG